MDASVGAWADAMLTAMREKGIALVPMTYTIEGLRELYITNQEMSEAERATAEKGMLVLISDLARLVQRATKAGVKIAAGSDEWMRYSWKTRGQATKPMLRALVGDGMSRAAAIQAATVDAAEVLGWSDRVGLPRSFVGCVHSIGLLSLRPDLFDIQIET